MAPSAGWGGFATGAVQGVQMQAALGQEARREALLPGELEAQKRDARVKDIQIKRAEQEQKWMDSYHPLPISMSMNMKNWTDAMIGQAKEKGLDIKVEEIPGPDGEPVKQVFINGAGMKSMLEYLTNDANTKKVSYEGSMADLKGKVANAIAMKTELSQKGDEKSLAKSADLDKQLQSYGKMMAEIEGLSAEMAKKEAEANITLKKEKELALYKKGLDGDKNQTVEQLTAKALKGDPEAQAILDKMNEDKVKVARQTGAAKEETKVRPWEIWEDRDDPKIRYKIRQGDEPPDNANKIGVQASGLTSPDSFPNWSNEQKDMSYRTAILTGKEPKFNYRDKSSLPAWSRGYNQYLIDNDMTPGDVQAKRGSLAGMNASLRKQETNKGMMGSFVKNMEGQIDRLDEIYKDLEGRLGAKIANIPIRKLKMSVLGSADESIILGYLTEIENEMNKLSQGAQASIAELSVESQKKWDKIHDKNLGIPDITKILKETRHMAQIRVKSVDDEIAETMKRISSLEKREGTPSNDSSSLRAKAIQELQARGKAVNEDTIKNAMQILGGQ